MKLLKELVLLTVGAMAGCGGAASTTDDIGFGTDVTLTHDTLDNITSPTVYGCGVAPTQAFPRYGGSAAGTCPIAVMAAMTYALEAPLPETVAATQGTPLPTDCRATRTTSTLEDPALDPDAIPAGCEFTYDALIGTVDAGHQIIEYQIHVDESPGCWPTDCDETIRLDYRKSMIYPQ